MTTYKNSYVKDSGSRGSIGLSFELRNLGFDLEPSWCLDAETGGPRHVNVGSALGHALGQLLSAGGREGVKWSGGGRVKFGPKKGLRTAKLMI